ncbi:MAG: hypothetical protein JSR17_08445 [Proteobacteria bacterium]|nr:hypothetical protein [Pseudomonadota bacterium]
MNNQDFIALIVEDFYENPQIKTSDEFLALLKDKYQDNRALKPFLDKLIADAKEDKYGTFTIILEQEPANLEFKFKKPSAYGGPKTEQYLDRIDLKVQAAIAYVNQQKKLSKADKEKKIAEIMRLKEYFKNKINSECYLDPKMLKHLKNNGEKAKAHFDKQHALAKKYLSVFMDVLVEKTEPDLKPKQVKELLYQHERIIMSDLKRPIRVNARAITLGTTRYYHIDTVKPVNPQRTVSSAKKDEAGVANWLQTSTIVLDQKYHVIDQRETYRSASIVPHEILKKGRLSKALAMDTARRNLVEHIIPALAEKLLHQDAQAKDPLVINYEMLTLLSPVHKMLDIALDPDLGQFEAIRKAFQHYEGRTFDINVNGKIRQVTFNGIYHNYGVNIARKIGYATKRTNQKAYNEIIERSVNVLNAMLPDLEKDKPFHDFIKNMIIKPLTSPPFTVSDELTDSEKKQLIDLKKYNSILRQKGGIYDQMDANSASFTKEEHRQLLSLNAKKNDKIPLTKDEIEQFKKLTSKFNKIKEKNLKLNRKAGGLETKIREIHAATAKARQKNFMAKAQSIEKYIVVIEKNGTEEQKEIAAHLRALLEFNKLIVAGVDVLYGSQDDKNTRNYEIQCYIERLNKLCGWDFHLTCKSGKDRTNAAIEKQHAKALISMHEQRVVQGQDEEKDLKKLERELFLKGYEQGPGNDICGDNMKPGAQQISHSDFTSESSFALYATKKVSSLQKGIDKLPEVEDEEKEIIVREYTKFTQTPQVKIGAHRVSVLHQYPQSQGEVEGRQASKTMDTRSDPKSKNRH